MFNNNIFGDKKITTKKITIYEEIDPPNEANSEDKESNLRYNRPAKKYQFYDGSAWQTFDTSAGTNLWEISGSDIQPISTYGVKFNDLYEKTALHGIDVHNTIKIDEIAGLTTVDDGTIFGVPIEGGYIGADQITFGTSPNLETLQNVARRNLSSGVNQNTAPTITDNNDGTCTIDSTTVQIRANAGSDFQFITVPTLTTSAGELPENATRYIYVEYVSSNNARYFVRSTMYTDFIKYILIAKIYRPLGVTELYINNKVCSIIYDLPKRSINATGVKQGEIHWESGATLSFSALQFAVSTGYFNCGLNEFSTAQKALAGQWRYLIYDGTTFNESALTTNINNTQYQGATALTTMTNNNWAVDFVYVTVSGSYYVIKSTSQATSLAGALSISLPTVPQRLINNGILIGKIVFQKSANINNVYSAFASLVTYQGATNHSDLANLSADDHTQYALINASQRQSGDTLYINNITTHGTDANLTFSTSGTGHFMFNIEPYPSNGKFFINNPSMTNGQFIDFFMGKNVTSWVDMCLFGYKFATTGTDQYSYFGIRGPSGSNIDKRIFIYGTGITTFPGSSYSLDTSTTEGNVTKLTAGQDAAAMGGIYYTYSATASNRFVSFGYDGVTKPFSAYQDGKSYFNVYEGTVTNKLKVDTITNNTSTDINIDHASDVVKNIYIGKTYCHDIYLGRSGYIVETSGNFRPTNYTSAATTEGVLTYDYAVGEKCLKYYNGSAWITLGKSGSNDAPTKKINYSNGDTKVDRLLVGSIEPKSTKEPIITKNIVLGDNMYGKSGSIGYDDMGFFAVNSNGMRVYFVGNNKANNKHGIDNVTYKYINTQMAAMNEEMKKMKEKMKKMKSKIKTMKSAGFGASVFVGDDMGNSLNMVQKK